MNEIKAQDGPQWQFLSTPADVAIYGGAAGGGKSVALLLEPLRHIHNPRFYAVLFRKTFPQVTNPGGLWDESMQYYPIAGGEPRRADLEWRFPSGARIEFAHMQHEDNRLDWQGSQIPLIEFDEATHFTKKQVFYMFSRNRSTCGVRPYIRMSCNPIPPDDPTGGWLHELIGWYIGEDGYAINERSGVIRWFANINDTLRWADRPEELIQQYPESEPKSFTFIKSSVYDNKILLDKDPGYLSNLKALPYIEQEQLLGGNWLVKPAAGKVFNKSWFEVVDAAPAGGLTLRFWDLAASEKKLAKDDPDFTAGIKIRYVNEAYYIMDCIEERIEPARTDTAILNTAKQDGKTVILRWETEGGASGKRDNHHMATLLNGYDARGVRPQGDKLVRAKGLAAQAYAGNVKLLKAPWNDRWLSHMHSIPDGAHDDIMDASAGGYNEVTKEARRGVAGSHQG